MRARFDYTALHDIPVNGVIGFRAGDDMTADQVTNLGLIVGDDVEAARTDVIPRPAGNAPRIEWAAFALGQGMTRDEVDGMGRDELRDRFPAGEARDDVMPLSARPQPDNTAVQVAEQTGQAVDGDEVPGGSVDDVLGWVGDDRTRAVMALMVERDRPKPRAGVVEKLEPMVAGE